MYIDVLVVNTAKQVYRDKVIMPQIQRVVAVMFSNPRIRTKKTEHERVLKDTIDKTFEPSP